MKKSYLKEFEAAAKLGAAKAFEKHKSQGHPIYKSENGDE